MDSVSGRTVLHRVRQTVGIRAVRATEHALSHFHAVTDNPARAVSASRHQRLNSALETIENVPLATDVD